MASSPSHADASLSERAIFTLLKPFTATIEGAEHDISNVEMRGLAMPDLPLLDQFRGQPIALAQNLIAALCDLTLNQVQQLDVEDFTLLASDALWQVQQFSLAMGLPAGIFFDREPEA